MFYIKTTQHMLCTLYDMLHVESYTYTLYIYMSCTMYSRLCIAYYMIYAMHYAKHHILYSMQYNCTMYYRSCDIIAYSHI